MKILILNGSPRKLGNTNYALKVIAEGIKAHTDNEVEIVDVTKLKVGPCIACEACKKNGGSCVIKDDGIELMDKVCAADVLILGTPIYWCGMSAQLKAVVDRFYAKMKQFQSQRKKVGVVAIGEDDLKKVQYKLISQQVQYICDYLGWDFPLYLSFCAGAPGDLEKTAGAQEALSEAWRKF